MSQVVRIKDASQGHNVYYSTTSAAALPTSTSDFPANFWSRLNNNNVFYPRPAPPSSDPNVPPPDQNPSLDTSAKYLAIGKYDSTGNLGGGLVLDMATLLSNFAQSTTVSSSNLDIMICDSYNSTSSTFTYGYMDYPSGQPAVFVPHTLAAGASMSNASMVTINTLLIVLPMYNTTPVASSAFGVTFGDNTQQVVVGAANSTGLLAVVPPPVGFIVYPTFIVAKAWLWIAILLVFLVVVVAIIGGVVMYKKHKAKRGGA